MKEILFQVFITTLELVCLSQIFILTMIEFSLNSIIHVCYDLSLRVIQIFAKYMYTKYLYKFKILKAVI